MKIGGRSNFYFAFGLEVKNLSYAAYPAMRHIGKK